MKRRQLRFFSGVSVVAGAIFLSGFSFAEDVRRSKTTEGNNQDDGQKARQAFESAQTLIAKGDYASAAKELETALRYRQTGGLYFHLGNCYVQLGRLVEAKKAFENASEVLREKPQKDVEEALPAAVASVNARLTSVELSGLVGGAKVFVDNVLVNVDGRLLVDPGERRLRIEAEGYEPFEETLVAKEGASLAVEPRMKRSAAPVSAAPTTASTEEVEPNTGAAWSTGRHLVFWSSTVVFAAGAGIATVGLINGASASGRASDADAQLSKLATGSNSVCATPTGAARVACDDLAAANSDQASAQVLSIIGFSAVGVGAVGALASAFFWPDEKPHLAASIAPGFASVSFETSF